MADAHTLTNKPYGKDPCSSLGVCLARQSGFATFNFFNLASKVTDGKGGHINNNRCHLC